MHVHAQFVNRYTGPSGRCPYHRLVAYKVEEFSTLGGDRNGAGYASVNANMRRLARLAYYTRWAIRTRTCAASPDEIRWLIALLGHDLTLMGECLLGDNKPLSRRARTLLIIVRDEVWHGVLICRVLPCLKLWRRRLCALIYRIMREVFCTGMEHRCVRTT